MFLYPEPTNELQDEPGVTMASRPLTHRRPRMAWVFLFVAILLGVLALIVVLQDASGRNANATTWTITLNLATGLFSLGGALGYGLRKSWGPVAFGLSVLGHFAAHGYLMLSLIRLERASVAGLVGLSAIPLLAGGTLIGMIWERRRRRVT